MRNFEWVVPVVVLIVWAINAVLRGREEAAPIGARGQRPAERNPSSDIDRFLQEIDRLRKQKEGERADPAAPVVPRLSSPLPTPPSLRRPRQQQQTPKPAVTRPRPQQKQAEPPVEVTVMSPTEEMAAQLPALPQLSPTVSRSAAGIAALSLLSDPRSAATAFVLREILAGPRCRQRLSR